MYYWRVRANNDCLNGEFTETKAFGTATLNCSIGFSSNVPINISQSGAPTIEATIPVTSTGTIVDVSVTKLKGLHDKVSDIAGFLISGEGTIITLWEEKCSNSSNYNLGFNDAAPSEVICPINTGNTFKPVTPFSTLAGEDAQGIWKIRIEDRDPGNGGTLDEASIEICSNASLDPPSLINNNTLEVPPSSGQLFLTSNLLTEDADNSSDELIYTMVNTTSEGEVFFNGTMVNIGDQFSQKDINDGMIRYAHSDSSSATSDSFTFTVNDGNGGWIGITTFNISIDESFTSSVEDIDDLDFISVYPNPTQNELFIDITQWDGTEFALNLYALDGKRVISQKIYDAKSLISLEALADGLYLVELNSGNKKYQKRILKQN